jgi:hypothetical protein
MHVLIGGMFEEPDGRGKENRDGWALTGAAQEEILMDIRK